jgi:hypothetical protein
MDTIPAHRPTPNTAEAKHKQLFHLRPMSTLRTKIQNTRKPRSKDSPDMDSRDGRDLHSAGLGLLLDPSGTRGMMSRKKISSRNGSTAA